MDESKRIYPEKTEELKKKYGVQIDVYKDDKIYVYTTTMDIKKAYGKTHAYIVGKVEEIQNESKEALACFLPCLMDTEYDKNVKYYDVSKTGMIRLQNKLGKARNISAINSAYNAAFEEMFTFIRDRESNTAQQAPIVAYPVKSDNLLSEKDIVKNSIANAMDFMERITKSNMSLFEQNKALKIENDILKKRIADKDIEITTLNNTIADLNNTIDNLAEGSDNEYIQAISKPAGGMLVREVAGIINQAASKNGYEYKIGQKALFKWLVNNGYLTDKHYPKQNNADLEYFTIVSYVVPMGQYSKQRSTTCVTVKGQNFLVNKFLDMLRKGVDIDAQCQ